MRVSCVAVAIFGLLISVSLPARAFNSHVETELASRGNLSLFYQALLNTGVANELSEDREYSIFAPTNAAFAQINARIYPCFYSVQCRGDVAAILRNHIVPRRESLRTFAGWGGEIQTLGRHRLDVEEPYVGEYTVDHRRILYRDDLAGLYQIDGVLVSDMDLALFKRQPLPNTPGTVTETVTTSRTVIVPPETTGGLLAPGGYPVAPPVYWPSGEEPTNSTTTTIIQTSPNH